MKLGRAIGVCAAVATLTFRAVRKDQRRIWSFPLTAARGDRWRPALGVLGTTAALVALDPTTAPWLQRADFQQLPVVVQSNRILSARHTAIAINAMWSLFWVGGLLRGDAYAGETGLLAGEAALAGQIVAISMKHLDRRMRPIEAGPDGDFTRTWFRTKNRNIDGAGCFPSGHTASSFAIAAVFAERYPRRPGVTFAAYALACIVGASRLTSRAHYPSDVFFGAVLGLTAGRHMTAGR